MVVIVVAVKLHDHDDGGRRSRTYLLARDGNEVGLRFHGDGMEVGGGS
jgi:hypothetical protein